MANTSNVKEMKNGRPQSVQAPKALPNCAIVTLGDTMEATKAELDHVHAVTAGAAQTAVGKFVIVAPEINVQQYRMIDNDIAGIFIQKNVRSTGVGKQLLDYLKSIKQGLSLHVYQKNGRAVAFYRREGFVIQGQSVDEDTGEGEFLMRWDNE